MLTRRRLLAMLAWAPILPSLLRSSAASPIPAPPLVAPAASGGMVAQAWGAVRDGCLIDSFNLTAFAKMGTGEFSIAWTDARCEPSVIAAATDCVVTFEKGKFRCVDLASGVPRDPADLRFVIV